MTGLTRDQYMKRIDKIEKLLGSTADYRKVYKNGTPDFALGLQILKEREKKYTSAFLNSLITAEKTKEKKNDMYNIVAEYLVDKMSDLASSLWHDANKQYKKLSKMYKQQLKSNAKTKQSKLTKILKSKSKPTNKPHVSEAEVKKLKFYADEIDKYWGVLLDREKAWHNYWQRKGCYYYD